LPVASFEQVWPASADPACGIRWYVGRDGHRVAPIWSMPHSVDNAPTGVWCSGPSSGARWVRRASRLALGAAAARPCGFGQIPFTILLAPPASTRVLSGRMSSLHDVVLIAEPLAKPDQITATAIPVLRLFHSSQPATFYHVVLKPSFCFVLRGEKQIHIGTEMIHYGPGDYWISTIDMPASVWVRGATTKAPYLGFSFEIDPAEIIAIATEAELEIPRRGANEKIGSGDFVPKSDRDVRDACARLVLLLANPRPSTYLADHFKREILYRLLTGKDGALFYQKVVTHPSQEGIVRAICWIKDDLRRPLKMKELAKVAGMSMSGLYRQFKVVTTQAPLQYQKQLRLVHARQTLLSGAANVAAAARAVGYASQSQFTREYRHLFGQPPLKDVRCLRQNEPRILQG
jgi:AraC-like DNA-binding protein